MTSQGSPYARLQRALASGNALVAWATASELPRVSLEDALALCLLLVDEDSDRYGRAAVRWHARLCREVPGVTIDESGLALAALRILPGRGGEAGARALSAICARHGLPRAEGRVDEWLERRAA